MRDGKDVPVTGKPDVRHGRRHANEPDRRDIVYSKGGKLAMNAKAAVAKDGKTMTATTTGTDAKGQAINNVAVYTKQ